MFRIAQELYIVISAEGKEYMTLIKRYNYHFIFFAIFPVLHLYIFNIGHTYIQSIFLPILVSLSLGFLVFGIILLFTRSFAKAGLFATYILIIFYAYGHIPLQESSKILISISILLILIAISIKWEKYNIKVNKMFTYMGSFLTIYSLLQISLHFLNADSVITYSEFSRSKENAVQDEIQTNASITKNPDIYYIILDGYGRSDILKKYFNFDNSDFIGYLESKGFYIANKSTSNYAQTVLSLTSSLNFIYLDQIVSKIGEDNTNRNHAAHFIPDNHMRKILSKHGYAFVSYATPYSFTDVKSADIYIEPIIIYRANEFMQIFVNSSALSLLFKANVVSLTGSHKRLINNMLDNLGLLESQVTPKFVFAHIMAPHPPFVFGDQGDVSDENYNIRDGSHLFNATNVTRQEYVTRYIKQLEYINTKLKIVIERIITNSERRPIIIIQSDHGPGSMLDWDNKDKTNMSERMSILNAYLLPDNQAKNMLYPTITPVNTFRIILSQYFDENYKMLEDRTYFSIWPKPYKFIDVTKEVNY